MSPKLHLEPAFFCIALHKSKKCKKVKINILHLFTLLSGGERGIRTPGGVTLNGFQDRRIRPLCHLSGANIDLEFISAKSF